MEEIEEWEQCSICYRRYSEERKPMMLCMFQHASCMECIDKLFLGKNKLSDQISCHSCKKPVSYQNITPFFKLKDMILAQYRLKNERLEAEIEKMNLTNNHRRITEILQLKTREHESLKENLASFERQMADSHQNIIKEVESAMEIFRQEVKRERNNFELNAQRLKEISNFKDIVAGQISNNMNEWKRFSQIIAKRIHGELAADMKQFITTEIGTIRNILTEEIKNREKETEKTTSLISNQNQGLKSAIINKIEEMKEEGRKERQEIKKQVMNITKRNITADGELGRLHKKIKEVESVLAEKVADLGANLSKKIEEERKLLQVQHQELKKYEEKRIEREEINKKEAKEEKDKREKQAKDKIEKEKRASVEEAHKKLQEKNKYGNQEYRKRGQIQPSQKNPQKQIKQSLSKQISPFSKNKTQAKQIYNLYAIEEKKQNDRTKKVERDPKKEKCLRVQTEADEEQSFQRHSDKKAGNDRFRQTMGPLDFKGLLKDRYECGGLINKNAGLLTSRNKVDYRTPQNDYFGMRRMSQRTVSMKDLNLERAQDQKIKRVCQTISKLTYKTSRANISKIQQTELLSFVEDIIYEEEDDIVEAYLKQQKK